AALLLSGELLLELEVAGLLPGGGERAVVELACAGGGRHGHATVHPDRGARVVFGGEHPVLDEEGHEPAAALAGHGRRPDRSADRARGAELDPSELGKLGPGPLAVQLLHGDEVPGGEAE